MLSANEGVTAKQAAKSAFKAEQEASDEEEFDVPEHIQHFNGDVTHEEREAVDAIDTKVDMDIAAGDPAMLDHLWDLQTFLAKEKKFKRMELQQRNAATLAAPVIDVDKEEEGWRKRFAKRKRDTRFNEKHSKLVYEFKRHRGDALTEAEKEEEMAACSESEPEDELGLMRRDWFRKQAKRDRKRRLKKEAAEALAAEAAAKAAAALAAAEEEDRLAGPALLAALESADEWEEDEEDEEKSFTDRLSEEDTDIEDRFYPDSVPHFLLDRKSSYVKISEMRKPKVPVRAQVPQQDKWWLNLVNNRAPGRAPEAAAKCEESSDDEIEIDFAPPDAVNVVCF